MSDNLKTPAGLVEAVIADFDELLAAFQVCDLPDALEARAVLATASMGLGQCREQLDTLIGDAMGTYRVVVDGFGFVERHHKKSRTKWDRDALLSAVRDTRLVDPETGEVIDPTPLDKVLHVWNLGAPRLGALKERGIDADEFCETEERKGWQLKV